MLFFEYINEKHSPLPLTNGRRELVGLYYAFCVLIGLSVAPDIIPAVTILFVFEGIDLLILILVQHKKPMCGVVCHNVFIVVELYFVVFKSKKIVVAIFTTSRTYGVADGIFLVCGKLKGGLLKNPLRGGSVVPSYYRLAWPIALV